ncbi:hypothetical protein [Actinomadura sp. HBU206391]|uniref:hypothetical protein n=1 Tax=Actinomadura sp. HBU206391 TaxID=2731692 RepID=UPI00164F8E40|nr:hypothetical protein [Actinomadura sp. HBU206391]MBC6462622.1 hypothetical protein [Actinomadura sp. HBU206391]
MTFTNCNAFPPQSWAALTDAEPRLLTLERDIRSGAARHLKRNGPVTIDHLWAGHGGYKRRLTQLAGWSAANPYLRTSTAYEVAYRHLYSVLEDYDDIVNGARY